MSWVRRLLAAALLAGAFASAVAQDEADRLLDAIKLALFDRDWQTALDQSRSLQQGFPDSVHAGEAIYFEAQALERLGRLKDALDRYQQLVRRPRGVGELHLGQAHLSSVSIAVDLCRQGDCSRLSIAEDALSSSDKGRRYYAALRLSFVPVKSRARRAVPVLREILRAEGDDEIRNRANLALLRIDPKLVERQAAQLGIAGRTLNLEVFDKDDLIVDLVLPLSLADFLVDVIPDEALDDLRKEGLDPRDLVRSIERSPQRILTIRANDFLFRIWIGSSN